MPSTPQPRLTLALGARSDSWQPCCWRIPLPHESLGHLGVGRVQRTEPWGVEEGDVRGQKACRNVDFNPADKLVKARELPLIGLDLRAVAIKFFDADLPRRVVLEPNPLGFMLGSLDAKDLAGCHLHINRRDATADHGVDEAALAALRLTRYEHGIAVVHELAPQLRECERRIGQVIARGQRGELVEECYRFSSDGLAVMLDLAGIDQSASLSTLEQKPFNQRDYCRGSDRFDAPTVGFNCRAYTKG